MAKLKIEYPSHLQAPTVRFGPGSLKILGEAPALGQTVFFLSSRSEVREAVDAALARGGHYLDPNQMIIKPDGEPTLDAVREAAAHFGNWDVDRFVAIGGGSVLDWARLAWVEAHGLLVGETGQVKSIGGTSKPSVWLVPTTCGTGAEAAGVAVYTHEGRKRAVVSQLLLADQVILDARLLESIPPLQFASFVCDALSHGIEGFVSIVPNPFAKEAAVSSLSMILENYGDRDKVAGKQRLLEASYLGGVAASNCSVGVIHAFAHAMAEFGVAHGLGNALGLMAGMRTNEDTVQMHRLVDRMKFTNSSELRELVRCIVSDATGTDVALQVLELLRNSDTREQIAEAMLCDVAIRSNPKSVSKEIALQFLELVREEAEAD